MVPLGSKARCLLSEYLESYRPDLGNDYFFTARKGQLCTTYVTAQIRRAAEAAGLTKRVTSHTLRHSFATNLYRNGVGLREIGTLLGHSSLVSTEVYTHVNREALTEAVNLL